MQVDFYHLARDPAEKLVPVLATKGREIDARLLIVARDGGQRDALSKALWHYQSTSFLAHDFAGSENEAQQPILIAAEPLTSNAAKFLIISDGEWRDEALSFERVFFLFLPEQIDEARRLWREHSGSPDVTPRYWKQDGGRWIEGP